MLLSEHCPVYSKCGGCDLGNLTYAHQVDRKKEILTQLAHEFRFLHCSFLPSNSTGHYRSRIYLRGRLVSDEINLGYFSRGSRDFVPISRCPIASKGLNNVLGKLLELKIGSTATVNFRILIEEFHDASNSCAATIESYEADLPTISHLVLAIRNVKGIAWAGLKNETARAPMFKMNQSFLFIKPGCFFQSHHTMNHLLRRLVTQKVRNENPAQIIDLFCGNGNLSVEIEIPEVSVLGYDSDPNSILCANASAKLAGREFRYVVQNLYTNPEVARGDFIIADPPRKGLGSLASYLEKSKPKNLLLVSCDIKAARHDINNLLEKGFEPISIDGLDFFPQTNQLEIVTHFRGCL